MPNRQFLLFISVFCFSLLVAACNAIQPAEPGNISTRPRTLVVASHDSFSASEDVIALFESQHNARLQFLSLGDAGEALNKIILSKDAPLADVFFGVDNTFLSRALAAGIFIPYASPALIDIPDQLELDAQHRLTPVDYGFVNINADQAWFLEHGIAIPNTLQDLATPEYRSLLVVQNPATSSPGLAFLLTTVAVFGENGYLDYWQALRSQDVLVTDGWSEAYFEHFTAGSGGTGDRPLVVSYSTSPPADVVYATDDRMEPSSLNVSPPDQTFRQVEFVGILQGTKQAALAQTFVDFLISVPFQEDIPLQMFVYPANTRAQLPDVFVRFAEKPQNPVAIDPEEIDANREKWVEAWTDIMLR